MGELPIVEGLRELWAEVDGLARRRGEVDSLSHARARAAFAADGLAELRRALADLRAAAARLDAAGGDGQRVWRETVGELRARAPGSLADPAPAIAAGELDLLILVRYTAASAALARERCGRVDRETAERAGAGDG